MTDESDIDPTPEPVPVNIKCGSEQRFNKDIKWTRTWFVETNETWPPANWNGLTQAQRVAAMNAKADEYLNNNSVGLAIGAAMQEAARKAVENDANIICDPCVPVGEEPGRPCVKVVPLKPPVVPPGGGSPAPDPHIYNASISQVTVGGKTGFSIRATIHFMYSVLVQCSLENCRCTHCGRIHGPDEGPPAQ
jgi:hypothetical protein